MTTDVTVPFTRVNFFNGIDLIEPVADCSFIGTAPYVDIADTTTSYASLDAITTEVAVYWSTPYAPPSTPLTAQVVMQVWSPDGFVNSFLYDTDAADLYWSPFPTDGFPVGAWTDLSFDITDQMTLLLSMLASGQEIEMRLRPSGAPGPACMISMMGIVLTCESEAPDLDGEALTTAVYFT